MGRCPRHLQRLRHGCRRRPGYGVDASHPDLDDAIVAGASILEGSTWSADPNGHGTAMAGIVAAETNNGEGIAGVGYAGVKVMPVTVLAADGTGQDSDVIAGVVWAADHGADVILMAFSSGSYSASLQAAVDYAWSSGVVLVAAAGNDGSSAGAFPAGDRGVIGVSNTTPTTSSPPAPTTAPRSSWAPPASPSTRPTTAVAIATSRARPRPRPLSPAPRPSCSQSIRRPRTAWSSGDSLGMLTPPARSMRPATAG